MAQKVTHNAMNMRLLNKKLESLESTISFAQNEGILLSAVTCLCGSYIDSYNVETRKNGWRRIYFKCKAKNRIV